MKETHLEELKTFAKTHYQNHWSGTPFPERQCLRWAIAGLLAWDELRGKSEPLVIQAGTASWRFAGDEDTDGPTHFTYLWDDASFVERYRDELSPEWHVWLASPSQGKVFDLTTGFQPQRLKERAPGAEWLPSYELPDALVLGAEELHSSDGRYTYLPAKVATIYALTGAATLLKDAGFNNYDILELLCRK